MPHVSRPGPGVLDLQGATGARGEEGDAEAQRRHVEESQIKLILDFNKVKWALEMTHFVLFQVYLSSVHVNVDVNSFL